MYSVLLEGSRLNSVVSISLFDFTPTCFQYCTCCTYCIFVLLSVGHEKIHARNSMYLHVQHFAVSDKLLLAILKAFVLQPLNKQQTIDRRLCALDIIMLQPSSPPDSKNSNCTTSEQPSSCRYFLMASGLYITLICLSLKFCCLTFLCDVNPINNDQI
jgi:hypothetical protein